MKLHWILTTYTVYCSNFTVSSNNGSVTTGGFLFIFHQLLDFFFTHTSAEICLAFYLLQKNIHYLK